MSKTSAKQRLAQLQEWLPTLKTQRGKRKKQQQSRMEYMNGKMGHGE
jgi:hypothetical protein